jgi:hypothetical protein
MWEAAWVSDHKAHFLTSADMEDHNFQLYQGQLSAEGDADVGENIKHCADFMPMQPTAQRDFLCHI